jgi:hypothetical protein
VKTILTVFGLLGILILVGRIAGEAGPAGEAMRQHAVAAGGGDITPIEDRVVLIARNEREMRFALAQAVKTPNVTISLVKGTVYAVSSPVMVRGRGTILNGNGAVIEQRFSRTGIPDPQSGEVAAGIAVLVGPRLGHGEPWSKEKVQDYLWMNQSGEVGRYAKALGAKERVGYNEPAPVQYPGPLLAHYTIARKLLVPAEHITVENLVIRCAEGNADIPMCVRYVKDVVVRGITAEGKWKTASALDVISSEDVLVEECGFSGVNLNSTNFCRITRCTGTVSLEEMVRWCDIDHNLLHCIRSNDITCEGVRILNNRFAVPPPDFGSIALPAANHFVIVGNQCDDLIWCGDVRGAVIQYNTAPHLNIYDKQADIYQVGNSWQNPPDN